MSKLVPMMVAEALPDWIEIEAAYANAKHGDDNPHNSALKGGLGAEDGASHLDLTNLYDRIRRFGQGPHRDEMELKASQAVGKFTNSGRALLSVIVQKDRHLTRPEADRVVLGRLRSMAGGLVIPPLQPVPTTNEEFKSYWEGYFERTIQGTAWFIEQGNLPQAASFAQLLIRRQARLFVAHACETGRIAMPGLNSTDELSALADWDQSATLGV